MRTQLNLLTERISFAEAREPGFHHCALHIAAPATAPAHFACDTLQLGGAPLSRFDKHKTPSAQLLPPSYASPNFISSSQTLLFDLHEQVPKMTPGQLAQLSLNFGVLDRIPDYFDSVLDGARLLHPIEFGTHLTRTALESLTLELRTLNHEYTEALYTEDRVMTVSSGDISGFVHKGRSIISKEVSRTDSYYHEVNRIAVALRHYYAIPEVPFDDDRRTKPQLRNVCRALTTAMERLKEGMDVFEQRLRDVAGCNAALQIGVQEAQPNSASSSPMSKSMQDLSLEEPFVLPNVMRPSQRLEVTTPKQMRALTRFFSEYAQIINQTFGDWAMLHGNLADLVNVIRDPSIRDINWRLPEEPIAGDVLSVADDNDEEQMACIRAIAYQEPSIGAPVAAEASGPSSTTPHPKSSVLR